MEELLKDLIKVSDNHTQTIGNLLTSIKILSIMYDLLIKKVDELQNEIIEIKPNLN